MTTTPHNDDGNPYRAPQAPLTTLTPDFERRDLSRDKRRIMLWMFALFSLEPCLEYMAGAGLEKPLTVMFGLVFGGQCVRWCYYDRLEQNKRLWRYLAATMILCPGPLLVLPVYFLYTRGVLQGLVASLGAFGYFILLFVVHIAMMYSLGLQLV